MKKNLIRVVTMSMILTVAVTACSEQSKQNVAPTTASVEVLSSAEEKTEDYAISGGTWFYHGIEDEKSIDMDGLKGFTTYTAEAIPETDGYLQYLGINSDGFHEFEVYDIYGKYFTSMIFVSEEQFYLGGDKDDYYVKWDYQ